MIVGCDRGDASNRRPSGVDVGTLVAEPIDPRGEPPQIDFPLALRQDDATVNKFVDDLLDSCIKGDYGAYRLAVASPIEPLPRKHFERAWQAIKQVRIRNLKRVHTPTTQQVDPARTDIPPELKAPIYCLHATVTLRQDPNRPPVKRPVREVVVLIVQENGQWKLGPPASLELKRRVAGIEAPADDLVTSPDLREDDSEAAPDTQPADAAWPTTHPTSQPTPP